LRSVRNRRHREWCVPKKAFAKAHIRLKEKCPASDEIAAVAKLSANCVIASVPIPTLKIWNQDTENLESRHRRVSNSHQMLTRK
jgi:hypothetical protein